MDSKYSVYMDSCCFIDLAKSERLAEAAETDHVFYCKRFLDAARSKHLNVYTSMMTVVECVKINHLGQSIIDDGVKLLFKGMLMSGKSGVWPVLPTPNIVERARDLLWVDEITCKPMDATHLATALVQKCTHFLTTDKLERSNNVEKLKKLGLIACTADQAIDLLPNEYRQRTFM